MGVLAVKLLFLLLAVGGAVQMVAGQHPYFFELLLLDPFGAKDTCLPLGAACSKDEGCCAGGCSNEDKCCKPDGRRCPFFNAMDDTCCNGYCNFYQCDDSPLCGRLACLGGSAQVRTLEPPGITALEDVKLGQHIECLDTDAEFRLPSVSTWCEVKNWVHAQNKPVVQYRVSFTRPDGSRHVQAAANFVTRLDDRAPTQATPVPHMAQLGAFEAVQAKELVVGDKVVVLVDEKDPTVGFTTATVTKVTRVKEATYLPAIDKPYIVVDGVVTALWLNHKVPLDVSLVGADQAVQHMLYSPLWMKRQQAAGIVAKEGQWQQDGVGDKLVFAHAGTNINHAKHAGMAKGRVLSYAATRQWFQPRYDAWKADPSKAITEADVLEFLGSKDAWVSKPAN